MTGDLNKGPRIGIRHVQVLLLFLHIVVVYISRLNAAISVVAMTDAEKTNPDFPEYDWTEMQKSYILSSFYWGYVFTQFPGGYLSRRFGAKLTMLISTGGSAVFSLVIPVCVAWGGWQAYCVIRIIQGLFQGLMFPCLYEHLAKWSPLEERNRLGALAHTGIECGTVLAMLVSGLIAASSIGWPGISYVSGGCCILVCVLWMLLASNNATESRYCSIAERQYIETSHQRSEDFHKQKIPIPWRAIFTSIPFYVLLVVRCAEAWGLTTVQAEMPSYMNGVLDLDIKENALYSTLPYLAMWFMSYVYVIVADMILQKKLLSLTALRKSFNSVAFCVPAAALIGVGFIEKEQKAWAIALLTIAVGANSGATIGSSLNTLDLAPNHAGIMMGIVNTIANFVPIFTPLVAGWIVTDKHDRSLWQIVFIIAAVIFFVCNLQYVLWGTAEVQPWNAIDFLADSQSLEKSPPIVKKPRSVSFVGIDNPIDVDDKTHPDSIEVNNK